MFFLVESSTGVVFASPYFPSVVAAPGAKLQEGTPIDRVVQVLGNVLASSKTSLRQKQEAVFALSRTRAEVATQVLRSGMDQADSALQLAIASALLERNDISALPKVEPLLLSPTSMIPPYLLHNLNYAISEGVKDEAAVPSLARLLGAPHAETRRAAASALRHTGSRAAIPALLSGLNDSDLQVRYYCAVGLAEITGQREWRPNMDDFLSQEKRYLNHWREWARNP
jgi:HEAT repeat protein